MQKKQKLQRQLLIAGFAGALLTSPGCRSAMPKWNMFGFNREPSPETLAGEGPSTTYPAPPSESSTPFAIASNAAGVTAPEAQPTASASPQTQIASNLGQGFDVSNPSGLKSPTGGPNSAAAQANGFNLASSTSQTSGQTQATLPGYAKPSTPSNSSVPATPVGYQFGQRSASTTKPVSTATSPASSYGLPGTATRSATAPSTSISSAPATASSGGAFDMPALPPASGTSSTGSSAGGFAMPDAMPKTVEPASATSSPAPAATPTGSASSIELPSSDSTSSDSMSSLPAGTPSASIGTGASTPSFSTASAELAPKPSASSGTSNSYAPGSTNGGSAYPASGGYPSTGSSGSYYR